MTIKSSADKGSLNPLILAIVLDAVCIGGGVLAWLVTDKFIWLAIGVVAGAGFTIPAVIKFMRANKGQK